MHNIKLPQVDLWHKSRPVKYNCKSNWKYNAKSNVDDKDDKYVESRVAFF